MRNETSVPRRVARVAIWLSVAVIVGACDLGGGGSSGDGGSGGGVPADFVITANGSSAYRFEGGGVDAAADDPTLTLTRGTTYVFDVRSGRSHPFYIKTTAANGGSNDTYDDGVTNNGASSGQITFAVPMGAPDTLFYQCSVHSGMQGTIQIVDP